MPVALLIVPCMLLPYGQSMRAWTRERNFLGEANGAALWQPAQCYLL
jgi:hypothetical protein